MFINENTGNQTAPSALMDNHAWEFMVQFLTTAMTYPEMEDAFFANEGVSTAYLGDRYSPDDWAEARDALWSGEGNDELSLENLLRVKDRYLPRVSVPTEDSSVSRSESRTDTRFSISRVRRLQKRRKKVRKFS
ncbi:hypothetical protein P692DRAFT_20738667 [Suillus brevipes Sb2]|nr:hypothetical protein P692DRAFT_20738667 [Suillus brevipes Sb2]